MKKVFAGIVVTMLLVATMGMTVFAASPTSDTALTKQAETYMNNVQSVSGATDNGTAVTVTKKAVSATEMSQAKSAVDAIGKNYTGGAEMLAVADLSVPSGTDVTKGVKVTLSVSGITSTDNIRVLHQNSSGTWEELPIVSVGNGSVTVKMTSFSPVAVVRVKGTQTSSSDSGSGTNNNGTDSSAANNGSNTNPPPTNDQSGSTTTNNNSQSNSQNQSNSQTNSNNQSNSQTNNQNNPVTVNQNVTVNYPDAAYSYEETYADGYVAGSTTVKGSTSGQTQTGSTGTGTGSTISGSVTSPKTGASLPALPILAVFAFAGILACGKKAQRQ